MKPFYLFVLSCKLFKKSTCNFFLNKPFIIIFSHSKLETKITSSIQIFSHLFTLLDDAWYKAILLCFVLIYFNFYLALCISFKYIRPTTSIHIVVNITPPLLKTNFFIISIVKNNKIIIFLKIKLKYDKQDFRRKIFLNKLVFFGEGRKSPNPELLNISKNLHLIIK
uniref:Transmembrane protein n=1 Tax=Heterorhabditis bacteriophora TaxID=37862 RepID=A0A1I7WKZ0_HETBA